MSLHIRFHLSLWLWSKLVPAMAYRHELATLLALTRPRSTTPYLGLAAGHIVKRVKHACRRPWLMRDRRCLREGLLALRFLSMAGYRPLLRFGVARGSAASGRVSAHCWVEVEGDTILNAPPPDMVEVLRHAPSGRGGPSRTKAAHDAGSRLAL